ncbi:DUF86 domain-containing protein [Fusobacterium sp. SB021]|uniref:HepT-like ribonuclease domain-containing protein n=1 Tax=Fusobacterium sp. SB021 TaxID=2744227 RepID=UPI003CE7D535
MSNKEKRTIEQFTYDIEDFITTIQEKTKNMSYEDFINSGDNIDAVEIRFLKIGEAVSQIQKLDKEILYKVYDNKSYWEQIKGTRNKLVHEYWGTSIEVLYYVAVEELDELLRYILKIRELLK